MEKKKCMIPAGLLSYLSLIPKELEPERKKPYTVSELKEVQKLLRDFGVERDVYNDVPQYISTVGQLSRWKNAIITETLENYRD